ncbi:hypothetical protein [Thermaurantiacus sp.]
MRTALFALLLFSPVLAQLTAGALGKLGRSHPDDMCCDTHRSIGNGARRERMGKINAEWKRLVSNNNIVAREVQE